MDNAITLSWLGISIATLAYFFFGFLWYSPLFGKVWAAEMGMDSTQPPKSGEMVKGMIINLIGCFLTAYVLTHNQQAWTFVPGMGEMSLNQQAIMGAFFTWLGFYLPTDLNSIAWERKSAKFFLINTSYHLIGLLIIALILANL